MAGNMFPRYPRVGFITAGAMTGSNPSGWSSGYNGQIGVNFPAYFQADASNGSFLQKILITSTATVSTPNVAIVIAVYVSSLGPSAGTTSAADTFCIGNASYILRSVDDPTNGSPTTVMNMNIDIQPSYCVFMGQVGGSLTHPMMAVFIGGHY